MGELVWQDIPVCLLLTNFPNYSGSVVVQSQNSKHDGVAVVSICGAAVNLYRPLFVISFRHDWISITWLASSSVNRTNNGNNVGMSVLPIISSLSLPLRSSRIVFSQLISDIVIETTHQQFQRLGVCVLEQFISYHYLFRLPEGIARLSCSGWMLKSHMCRFAIHGVRFHHWTEHDTTSPCCMVSLCK